jgi:hypothetical protein
MLIRSFRTDTLLQNGKNNSQNNCIVAMLNIRGVCCRNFTALYILERLFIDSGTLETSLICKVKGGIKNVDVKSSTSQAPCSKWCGRRSYNTASYWFWNWRDVSCCDPGSHRTDRWIDPRIAYIRWLEGKYSLLLQSFNESEAQTKQTPWSESASEL